MRWEPQAKKLKGFVKFTIHSVLIISCDWEKFAISLNICDISVMFAIPSIYFISSDLSISVDTCDKSIVFAIQFFLIYHVLKESP